MHILLDFDGTITQEDTIDLLGSFAARFQQQSDSRPLALDEPDGSWTRRWQAVVEAYMADHRSHAGRYAPAEADRTTLAQELAFLRSLRDAVDLPAIRRVQDAQLFAGLRPEHLCQAGRDAVRQGELGELGQPGPRGVLLRAGFRAFLREMAGRRGCPVAIVSINWSDAWIRGVVGTCEHGGAVRIFSNTTTGAGELVANFDRRVEAAEPVTSSADKLETMGVAVGAGPGNEPVVYIGDSTTDLECLLSASGGGIVMTSGGPNGSGTLKTLARLQYHVPHVSESPQLGRATAEGRRPRLAWAANFDEILASGVLG